MLPWAHPSPHPKRHLDRISRFCRAHDRDRQTDRQTTVLRLQQQAASTYVVPQCGLIITTMFTFYSAPQCSHCKRCTSYGNSVRLSVRLSHAGIVSKRRHVARCSLHCQIAICVWFCSNQKIFPMDEPFPLKSWFKLTYPLLTAASLDPFCLVAQQR